MLHPVRTASYSFARSGIALGAIAILAAAACGSSTDTSASASGSGGGASHSAVPPPAGPQKPGDGQGVVLAIKKLYLGDYNRDGTPNTTNGWRQYGFDIDGKISDPSSTDLCKPVSGAQKDKVYQDGDNGIDNSFGANILPTILGLAPMASDQINSSIANGKFTIMLEIQKLGTGTDYNPLLTQLYGGADLMSAPKWDGNDKWPVLQELLVDPTNISRSKVQFASSYVTGNTWVSGDPKSGGTIAIKLNVAGFDITLTVNHALLDMKLSEDHKSATMGTLAGIIDADEFITELGKIAGNFGICPGDPEFDSIAMNLKQASDIMKDGTQNPNATCDGISVGLGFDMAEVQLGAIAPPAMAGKDPCSMGTGGAGGGA